MWLNRAIKTLWPVYNETIAKMAIEQAKPQIDAALKGVGLFVSVVLGNVAPVESYLSKPRCAV